jgi:hypothetical protein
MIISVIIRWKLNGCKMLCSVALCGLSLGLVCNALNFKLHFKNKI